MSDYADWSVPQANATAISVTGVPLLSNPNLLLSQTYLINAGASTTLTSLPFTQPGYEVSVAAYQSGGGAAGPLEISMVWLDESDVFTIAQETWDIWPGTMVGTHAVYGKGPTKGSILAMQMTNSSAAMQYTAQMQIWQRSHLYTRDDWRSRYYSASASGNTIATNDPTSSLIGNRSLSVGAAASDTAELPLYSGLAYLYMDTASLTTDMTLTIQDSADPNGIGLGTRIQRYESSSVGIFSAQIALPRYQCKVVALNGNAAAKNLFWSLHAIDQAV